MNTTYHESFANCSLLASRTSFASYIQELNATTGFNVTLLQACQSDICNALWGDGNADISGIGMIVGYLCESILGFLFALSLAIHEPLSTARPFTKYSSIFVEGCNNFFDCAVFFAISIQISCVVVLVRRDFGISANGLGGLTVEITWAVALLCMLPLLYPMVILEFADKEKSNYRFFIFCGCWILFFYTFISQMVGEFAPSQVGQGAGSGGTTIITVDEWNELTSLCLSGVEILSTVEQRVLSGFGAAGSLAISIYGLGYLVWFIGKSQNERAANSIKDKAIKLLAETKWERFLMVGLVIAVPILTVPQIWGIMRLRGIQKALASASNNAYVDNQWTFGQVVAVMIFAPVFTEVGYLLLQQWKHSHNLPKNPSNVHRCCGP